jgi:hypothetical protein
MKAKLDPKVREKLDKEGSAAVRDKMPAIMAVTALGKETPVDLGDGVTCTSRDVQQWLEELDAKEATRAKIGLWASVIAAVFAVFATAVGILAWQFPVTP